MLILKTREELAMTLSEAWDSETTIGFVPTMGALHEGHLSLIDQSAESCDITVCSIFVNPTQFNDKNDLARYPRTPEADIALLEESGCDILFLPGVEDIYPEEDTRVFDFGYLDKILEGAHRPGHFNGVAQVVSILFDLVQPDKAFFGAKDYQQVMIVKAMAEQLELPVEIVPCPILRESDGLAMSSRNRLLNPQERKVASKVPQFMQLAKAMIEEGKTIPEIKAAIEAEAQTEPLMRMDYIAICQADTLQELEQLRPGTSCVILIAIFVGKIRLIDNLTLVI